MACPRIDHSLFQKIRSEHEQISLALERLQTLSSDEAKKELCLWLWDFVEIRHHEQEERLIFEKVYRHPKITEGGPLCTLYFDFHMADNPLRRAEELTKNAPQLEKRHKVFYEANSPVKIPLEEHRGGKEILRFLLSEWSTLPEAQKNICMQAYKSIQTQHMAKEETCFFHLCLRLLSESELDQISNSWMTTLKSAGSL